MILDQLKTYKPDIEDAAKRMAAYWSGDLIGRPALMAAVAKPGYAFKPRSDYWTRCYGDLDEILANAEYNAAGTVYLGECVPAFWVSFGTHELAMFLGAEPKWAEDGGDTNWVDPIVEDWDKAPPIAIDEENPFWQRMLLFYRKAHQRFEGRILLNSLDFHSNMDLLLSLRGDMQLCYDVVDCPERIDRAMEETRAYFRALWERTIEAGHMDETGYEFACLSETRGTIVSCDFMALVGQEMFRRWILPTIVYETEQMEHVKFHWDGPDAIKHFDDLMSVPGIHTISYVPNHYESHKRYIDLYERVQKAGKSVEISGTPDEIKWFHERLRPEKTLYRAYIRSEAEFDELDRWLRNHT